MALKTTVVLTTYNGMKYLEPLLDSLRMQTREIDEVLIFDDQSSDGTVAFMKQYIQKNMLTNWIVTVNKTNKGWKKNFRDGILSASCDLIFPCDQDDIWDSDKIKTMTACFELNQSILLLSSNYTPLYEEGSKKVDSFDRAENSTMPIFIKDDEKFAVHTRPGCVMCVRKSFAERLKVVWFDEYAHDAFLWTAATLCKGNYIIQKPLIQFRRHDSNTSTGAHRTKENQIVLMEMGEAVVDWYVDSGPDLSETKLNMINEYKEWCRLRTELLKQRKLFNFFKLFHYRLFFRSTRQEFGDFYYIMKGK